MIIRGAPPGRDGYIKTAQDNNNINNSHKATLCYFEKQSAATQQQHISQGPEHIEPWREVWSL